MLSAAISQSSRQPGLSVRPAAPAIRFSATTGALHRTAGTVADRFLAVREQASRTLWQLTALCLPRPPRHLDAFAMNVISASPARRVGWAFTFCLLAGLAGQASGQHLKNKLHSVKKETLRDLFVRQPPATGEDDCIEQLAREIDWLEAYLDRYGSVVAKHPDVWGESRLTKFRNEYEQELARRISCFKVRDNAAIARSDLAFLASATGLGLAIESPPPASVSQSASSSGGSSGAGSATTAAGASAEPAAGTGTGTSATPPDVKPETISQQITWAPASTAQMGINAASNLEPTTELDQLSRYINHLHELRRINEGDDTSDSPGYSLNLVRIPVSINPGRDTRRGHGAEITITATPHISPTLLPETFRSLVVNDLVDQLALPVLKLAEDPNLGFTRDVQEFDRKHRVSIKALEAIAREVQAADPEKIEVVSLLCRVFPSTSAQDSYVALRTLIADAVSVLTNKRDSTADSEEKEKADEGIRNINETMLWIDLRIIEELPADPSIKHLISALQEDGPLPPLPPSPMLLALAQNLGSQQKTLSDEIRTTGSLDGVVPMFSQSVAAQAGNAVKNIHGLFRSLYRTYEFARVPVIPVTRRRAGLPVAQVMVEDVIGRIELVQIAIEFRDSYRGRYVAWNGDPEMPRIHLADVRHFLQTNFRSAHDLLALPQNRALIQELIEPGLTPEGLAAAVRSASLPLIDSVRARFAMWFQPGSQTTSIMTRLAWPVLIEMALLSEQLNRDVHDIAVSRGDCGCHPTDHHKYYLPMPHDHEAEQTDFEFQAATEAFQNYVRCRWPIIVFHIDPVNEEQNVRESSLIARELAIAVSLSLASGRMNFQQANRFTRQYQEQIEAIGLNRTISGFSHGNDTFGWRFRPRIQTHKSQSTVRAFGETLFGRGPDASLREAALEPGMRECTAIVLMPSFVPYCNFDVRSNWFRLDNPRASDLSMHQSMQLSRSIRAMQDCSAQCIQCEHLYRDGEVDRLMRRVHQLDRELPLQSMRAQIPYENTLGGFEMFSNGVTDLAPELVGWYGGPGIVLGKSCPAEDLNLDVPGAEPDAECKCRIQSGESLGKGTTVFLVGDNFSVHETRVIAGGVELPKAHVKLISRQVLQVTVPGCVQPVVFADPRDPERMIPYVAIHAATPYGVTSHLHIPALVVPEEPAATQVAVIAERLKTIDRILAGISWTWAPATPLIVDYSFHSDGKGVYSFGCLSIEGNPAGLGYALTCDGPKAPLKLADLPVRVVGQLTDSFNNPLGQPFWLLGGVAQNDRFEVSADDVLKSAEVQLRNLTLDQLGNEPEKKLRLHAHVVFAEGDNSATPTRLLGEPNYVTNQITLVLHRRINPPANQRCTEPAPGSGETAPAADPNAILPDPPEAQGSAAPVEPRFVPLPVEPVSRLADRPESVNLLRATPATLSRQP
jgi:hypothetical protein